MKICFANDRFPGFHKVWAGAEVASLRVAQLLRKHHHEVEIISMPPDHRPESDFMVHGVPIMGASYIGRRAKNFSMNFLPIDPVSLRESKRILKKMQPDVLHLHNFMEMSWSLLQNAWKSGVPAVFSMYDFLSICPKGILINKKGQRCTAYHGVACVDCFEFKRSETNLAQKLGLTRFGFRLRRAVTDKFLKRLSAIIVLSQTWKEIMLDMGLDGERIYVVPLPIMDKDDDRFSEIEEDSLLFAGWIHPHKGLHVLIEALPAVIAERPAAKLYVIESGVDEIYKARLLAYLDEKGLGNRVLFQGKRQNHEVKEYLNRAEIVVVPEQWGIAWPIFLTEAMLRAKPIVSSRIGDIPSFIVSGESGLLAEPGDSLDFSRQIIWLLQNKEKAKQFGLNARILIKEKCEEEKIYKLLLSIYKRAVKRET